MPFTDLIIWFLAIYGLAKFIADLDDKYQLTPFLWLSYTHLVALPVSACCVWFYFPAETLFVKSLICFASSAFSHALARMLDHEY